MKDNSLKTAQFKKGIRDGLPIGLGYLSVSFAFGVKSSLLGVPVLLSVLISATNLTSAGQLAGLEIIARAGTLIELILTQLVINSRYFLMSVTLTQKLDDGYNMPVRLLHSAFITDEIFIVSVTQGKSVKVSYFFGLIVLPYAFWVLGTLFGALLGAVLPSAIQNALGISLYAMFIAIIVPPIKADKGVCLAVLFSALISCVLYYVPFLADKISFGFAIIISAVVSSLALAYLFPIKGGKSDE
ncbi:MAG: AzlC family ABC transporter permease [Christensenellaceae bacterium]